MRTTLLIGSLAGSILGACNGTICDQSWPTSRTSLIREGICNGDNTGAIEDKLGALDIQATPGTIVVIDTSSGRIARVPSSVTEPGNSRDQVVDIDAAGAEIIRSATESPSFRVSPEGVGFMVAQHDDAPDEAVLVATSITIGAGTYVRVIGDRALTLVSPVVAIDGIVDLAAGCADNPADMSCAGPGGGLGALFPVAEMMTERSLAGGCGPGGNGMEGSNSDTGGGGGGFGTSGGAGGSTITPESIMQPGGSGGAISACPGPELEPLTGGSGGGYGEGEGGGSGGGGGGAMRIVASCEIRIGVGNPGAVEQAGIWAAGGGGSASFMGESGGGGGGSGGAIVLESPSVTVTSAVLAANGGSGGRGGVPRDPVQDGSYGLFGDMPAPGGGMDEHAGGAGGAGTFAAEPGASAGPGVQLDGTGGGGGAVGRIRVNAKKDAFKSTGGVLSPAVTEGIIALED